MRPSRHLLLVIIFACTAGLTAAKASQTAPTTSPAHARADASQVFSAVEYLRSSQPVDGGCKAGEDNRRSDLCAQWKAADAAMSSADAAEEQVFISWLALLLGTVTMAAAIAAAMYARRAAVATENTVEIARNTADGAGEALSVAAKNADAVANQVALAERHGEFRLRAYVAAVDLTWSIDDSNAMWVHISIKNSGLTPALDVQTGCALTFHRMGENEPVAMGSYSGSTVLSSNEKITIKTGTNPAPEKIENILAGDWHIVVVAIVVYCDVFGKSHHTKLRYRSAARSRDRGLVLEPSDYGNLAD